MHGEVRNCIIKIAVHPPHIHVMYVCVGVCERARHQRAARIGRKLCVRTLTRVVFVAYRVEHAGNAGIILCVCVCVRHSATQPPLVSIRLACGTNWPATGG